MWDYKSTFTWSNYSDTITNMGRVGQALKQALKSYGISQNKLAVALSVDRSIVFRWFHERADPTGETIADIVKALKEINPDAAEMFVELYLGELIKGDDEE
ncbi:MAG: helix-turn-helix transcriptional regulator [Coleofasciculaceae cyanobacterium]